MKKTIFAVLVLFLGMINTVYAQATKFGYINTNELLSVMPETLKAEEQIKKLQDSLVLFQNELQREIQEKDSIIVADSAKWTPAKRDIKIKEVYSLQYELSNLQNNATPFLQQKFEELMAPVRKIASDAIQKVAKANGYTYVFEAQTLAVKPSSDDLLARVKTELKIVEKPSGTQK